MPDSEYMIRSSPHFKDKDSVPKIMYTVIIALLPAVFASVYYFRLKAVVLYFACLVACLVKVLSVLVLKIRVTR